MKRVYIIHRWDGNPEEPMYKWLKKELERKQFEVHVPKMPNPDAPKIKQWVSKIKRIVKNPDLDTYFIGHSIGCQAILRYLEKLKKGIKIGGNVFIAPWVYLNSKKIEEEGEEVKQIAKPWIRTPINWARARTHSDKFVCIFSNNDYYVPLMNKDIFEISLSSETIIEHNKGHFTKDDDVKTLPVVIEKIKQICDENKKNSKVITWQDPVKGKN